MVKSLLAIIQQVAGELAQNAPSVVLSATDRSTQQFKALAIAACDELCDMHDWQALSKKFTLTTQPGVASYSLPDDFLRLVPNTGYNNTDSRRLNGSTSPSEWSFINEFGAISDHKFRLMGNKILLNQVPGNKPHTVSFEYISSNYVYDKGLRVLKSEFQNDSDETVFPSRLLMLFIKLKFLQAQGLNTQAAAESFNVSLQQAKASDLPAPRIYLTRRERVWPYMDGNIVEAP